MGKIPKLTNIFQMGWNHQLVYHVISHPRYICHPQNSVIFIRFHCKTPVFRTQIQKNHGWENPNPKHSMYGIFIYMDGWIYMVNVGKYTNQVFGNSSLQKRPCTIFCRILYSHSLNKLGHANSNPVNWQGDLEKRSLELLILRPYSKTMILSERSFKQYHAFSETNSSPLKINGWFRWHFLLGFQPIFRGKLAVGFRGCVVEFLSRLPMVPQKSPAWMS